MNTQTNQKKRKNTSEENKEYEKIRLKIFIIEMIREPFDEIKDMIIKVIKGIGKPKLWKWIGFILLIYSIIKQDKIGAIIMIIFIITMEAAQQWIDGSFMNRYRQRKYGKKYYTKKK